MHVVDVITDHQSNSNTWGDLPITFIPFNIIRKWDNGVSMHHIFIDLIQVYDSIMEEVLCTTLIKFETAKN